MGGGPKTYNGSASMSSATPHSSMGGEASSRTYQWLHRYPDGVDWDRTFTPTAMHRALDASVQKYGDRPCSNFLGKITTYREIGRQVDRVAAGLQKEGVRQGTKVGLFMPNCPTFIIY